MIFRSPTGDQDPLTRGVDLPVIPGPQGAARPPRSRADKTLVGRAHDARRGPLWPVEARAEDVQRALWAVDRSRYGDR